MRCDRPAPIWSIRSLLLKNDHPSSDPSMCASKSIAADPPLSTKRVEDDDLFTCKPNRNNRMDGGLAVKHEPVDQDDRKPPAPCELRHGAEVELPCGSTKAVLL